MKFNEQTRERILGALQTGIGRRQAAEANEVSKSQMNRWLARGNADIAAGRESEHAAFYRDVVKAEASVIGSIEHSLHREARAGDVRAQLAVLAQRRPLTWSPEARQQTLIDEIAESVRDDIYEAMRRHRPEILDEFLLVVAKEFAPELVDDIVAHRNSAPALPADTANGAYSYADLLGTEDEGRKSIDVD